MGGIISFGENFGILYLVSSELVINRIGSPNKQIISQDQDEDIIKYHIEFSLYFKFKIIIIKWEA